MLLARAPLFPSMGDRMPTQTLTFPLVERLDFRLDPVEDRIVLTAHTRTHGERLALLTRRMVGVLLTRYAGEMERSSPMASRAASGDRSEVLRMEHGSALDPWTAETAASPSGDRPETARGPGGGEAPPRAPSQTADLVLEIKLKVDAEVVLLGLLGTRDHGGVGAPGRPQPICLAALGREDAHRVLAALAVKVREADWNLPPLPAWLGAGMAPPGNKVN
jgi:hypothetical protein